MLYELGDIGFSYFHNHLIQGVRKHIQLDVADDNVAVDTAAVFEKLQKHFGGKFLLDMGFCEVWNDFTNTDKVELWYEDFHKTAQCVILEKENGTCFIQDVEAIVNNGFNKDFSAVAGYRVILQDGMYDASVEGIVFNCTSGFLNGHSPRIRITKNGVFDIELSIQFANTLQGMYFTDEGYLLYDSVDNAPKANFVGISQAEFTYNNPGYQKHFGMYINKGKERLVWSDTGSMFVVGDEVTPENIAKVLMRIWGKRDWNKEYVPLLGCEVEILDF